MITALGVLEDPRAVDPLIALLNDGSWKMRQGVVTALGVLGGLRGSDLSAANLSGANLTRVDLTEANLSGADLRKANLCDTCLRGANLAGATLDHIDLRGIPWLIIMELTLQPDTTWKNVLYDHIDDDDSRDDEAAAPSGSRGSLDDG